MKNNKNPTDSPAFIKTMNALRRKYLIHLKERVVVLREFLESCESGKFTLEKYEVMVMEVHKLNGSGAIYGYKKISETACILEDALLEKAKPETLITMIRNLLDACAQALSNKEGD